MLQKILKVINLILAILSFFLVLSIIIKVYGYYTVITETKECIKRISELYLQYETLEKEVIKSQTANRLSLYSGISKYILTLLIKNC